MMLAHEWICVLLKIVVSVDPRALSSTPTSGRCSPLIPRGRHIIIGINGRAYNVTRYSVLFVIVFITICMYVVNLGVAYFL